MASFRWGRLWGLSSYTETFIVPHRNLSKIRRPWWPNVPWNQSFTEHIAQKRYANPPSQRNTCSIVNTGVSSNIIISLHFQASKVLTFHCITVRKKVVLKIIQYRTGTFESPCIWDSKTKICTKYYFQMYQQIRVGILLENVAYMRSERVE
jgi:hypothetical protein